MTTLIFDPPLPMAPVDKWIEYRDKLDALIADEPGNELLVFARDSADVTIKAKETVVGKFNPYHKPAGPGGGQFTTAGGGGGVIMVKDKFGNEAPVTEDSSLADHLVKNPDGTYSLDPEREKLHAEIIADYLKTATPQKGAPQFFMTGGGPASGKSSVLLADQAMAMPADAVHVDPDSIKAQLPEFLAMRAAGNKAAGSYVHEESSLVRKQLEVAARAGNYNVVLDTTGDSSVDKLASSIETYRAAGYQVNAVYATNSVDLAQRLNHQRYLKTGRLVPETFLRETHANVSRTFEAATRRNLFDSVKLYDTNELGNPRLVASGNRGSFTVHDRRLWNDFTAKGESGDATIPGGRG